MSGLHVEVHAGEGLDVPIATERIERVMRWTLAAEGVREAELSLALVGDAEITALNEQYLSHDGPTDVISFHLHDAGQPPLGDVYVDAEQARRQAEEHGATPAEELLRLAVHGTLHVLGYDHPEGEGRTGSPMFRRQEELLASFLEQERPS